MESIFLTRPLVSGILFSNSDLSVSYLVFKTKTLVSLLFTLATNLSHAVFLTTSFLTTSLSSLKSTRTGPNLSLSYLSSSVFKLSKFVFNSKFEVSTCAIFCLTLLHNLKDQL